MQSQNLKIARKYLGELWSLGRLEAAAELVSPGCAVHDSLVGDYVGADALAAHVRETRRAFPGLAWTIDEVLADAGPQVALSWSARATGQPVANGLLLLRIEQGKVVAIAAHWNPRELFRKLATKRPARLARGSTPAISTAREESELDAQW